MKLNASADVPYAEENEGLSLGFHAAAQFVAGSELNLQRLVLRMLRNQTLNANNLSFQVP
jgi:hypothetical protein